MAVKISMWNNWYPCMGAEPLVSLVCLRHFHGGVNRSVWLWLCRGIKHMHWRVCTCVREESTYTHKHTWVWFQTGTVDLGRYFQSNSASSDLSWFSSCTQITCSYPQQAWQGSLALVWPPDKERQQQTDNTDTLSVQSFAKILSHRNFNSCRSAPCTRTILYMTGNKLSNVAAQCVTDRLSDSDTNIMETQERKKAMSPTCEKK